MDIRMSISDTEVVPRIKLEQFEFDILKMSKETLRRPSTKLQKSVSICT